MIKKKVNLFDCCDQQEKEALRLLNQVAAITLDLKVENVGNPDWYHFDKAWENISAAYREIVSTLPKAEFNNE